MRILIESIPHADQRYDTCGDWYYSEDCTTLHIKVSELRTDSDEPAHYEMELIAIHELIESVLCANAGITQDQVDKFDKAWTAFAQEPGDDVDAPYYKQHQFAAGVERILAAEMRVDWLEYEHIIEMAAIEEQP